MSFEPNSPVVTPPPDHPVPLFLRFPPGGLLGALAVWGALQGSAAFLLGQHPTVGQRALLSAALGAMLLGAGLLLDGTAGRAFTTWLYVAALVIFRVGVAGVGEGGGWAHLLHLWVDAALLLAAFLLRRPLFALAATLGGAACLGALLEAAGVDGVLPGFVLGLLAAGLGALYLGHRLALEEGLARRFPRALLRVLPGRRDL